MGGLNARMVTADIRDTEADALLDSMGVPRGAWGDRCAVPPRCNLDLSAWEGSYCLSCVQQLGVSLFGHCQGDELAQQTCRPHGLRGAVGSSSGLWSRCGRVLSEW